MFHSYHKSIHNTTFGAASDAGDAIDHADNTNAHTYNVDLWKQCFDTIKQKSCEYSSGVCFVEERRVWGYVTQVIFVQFSTICI